MCGYPQIGSPLLYILYENLCHLHTTNYLRNYLVFLNFRCIPCLIKQTVRSRCHHTCISIQLWCILDCSQPIVQFTFKCFQWHSLQISICLGTALKSFPIFTTANKFCISASYFMLILYAFGFFNSSGGEILLSLLYVFCFQTQYVSCKSLNLLPYPC